MDDELSAATRSLQQAIESLVELGVVTSDSATSDPSGDLVQRKVRAFAGDARAVLDAAQRLDAVLVPLDILAYIDDGRNPDVYSREFVELVARQNQSVAGTLGALRTFQRSLGSEIAEHFPQLADAVAALE